MAGVPEAVSGSRSAPSFPKVTVMIDPFGGWEIVGHGPGREAYFCGVSELGGSFDDDGLAVGRTVLRAMRESIDMHRGTA